jgi:hypothetical protein
MRWPWALSLFVALGACDPCPPTGDIQVSVVSPSGLDPAAISRLRVLLAVDGSDQKSLEFTPRQPLSDDPQAFLLRPDPPPAPSYEIALTIEAMSAQGELVAIGSTGGRVAAAGCNRLEVRLTSLRFGGDAGAPADLAPSDLAGCVGGIPDEDGDGRADFCDLCPADFDSPPTDGDGDGVPDACDPDPTLPGNATRFFDPFNLDTGQWSGGFPTQSGYFNILTSPSGTRASGNGSRALDPNVRVQSSVYAPYFIGNQIESEAGVYLGTSPNPGSGSSTGMLCRMSFNQQSRVSALVLSSVRDGVVQNSTSAPFAFGTEVRYRVRLTQRGANYVCEASANGIPARTLSANHSVGAPTGPLFMVLHAENIEAHFHSVFAVTAAAP